MPSGSFKNNLPESERFSPLTDSCFKSFFTLLHRSYLYIEKTTKMDDARCKHFLGLILVIFTLFKGMYFHIWCWANASFVLTKVVIIFVIGIWRILTESETLRLYMYLCNDFNMSCINMSLLITLTRHCCWLLHIILINVTQLIMFKKSQLFLPVYYLHTYFNSLQCAV